MKIKDKISEAATLTDDAIALAHTNNPEDLRKAIQMLAAATHCQNVAITKLCKALKAG